MPDICRKTVNHQLPDALRDREALCNDPYQNPLAITQHLDFGLASCEVTIYAPAISPVPEPASLLLITTGIAGIAGLRRRKQRAI